MNEEILGWIDSARCFILNQMIASGIGIETRLLQDLLRAKLCAVGCDFTYDVDEARTHNKELIGMLVEFHYSEYDLLSFSELRFDLRYPVTFGQCTKQLSAVQRV